jgi:uncharacterized protein
MGHFHLTLTGTLYPTADKFERSVVESMPERAEPDWDGKDWAAGYASTMRLMQEGRPWIHGGVLLGGDIAGIPDLLKMVPGQSRLGDHTYVPIDIKGHKAVTKKDRYQLFGYSLLLEPVLGYRPTDSGIWLNTGEIADVDLAKYQGEFAITLEKMELVRKDGLATFGARCGDCGMCPWSAFCASVWKDTQSVCLLYGGTGKTAIKLAKAGFVSWRDIAAADPDEIVAGAGVSLKKASDLWLYAQAYAMGKPQPKKPVTFPSGVPIHFYDIETYGDCTYLHGNIRVFGDEREERQFLAREPSQEEAAWHEYLDYLAADDDAIVYCWSDYERGYADALWGKYGGNPNGWQHLRDSLVDQCAFTRDHFALATPSYSIKKVAPLFGFSWDADDAGGLNSEAWYKEWLEAGDEAIIDKILRYNLDDIVAMEVIHNGLRAADDVGGTPT